MRLNFRFLNKGNIIQPKIVEGNCPCSPAPWSFHYLPPAETLKQWRTLGRQYRWQWPPRCGQQWHRWRASSTLAGKNERQVWCGVGGVGTGTGVSLRPDQLPKRPDSAGRHCGRAGHQLPHGSALTERHKDTHIRRYKLKHPAIATPIRCLQNILRK